MSDRTFKIITLGCKVNQFESASLVASLEALGLKGVGNDEEADITVVNTCIVTERAASQSRQAIRKAVRENPSGDVAAVGCYGQVFAQELAQIEGVKLVAGNADKERLPEILVQGKVGGQKCVVSGRWEERKSSSFFPQMRFLGRARAFLKIQDGCQSRCSYCIVPLARGPLRSTRPAQVISMIESLSKEGYQEVVLSGIHLGKYGEDLPGGTDLEGLLDMIGREGFPLRIRLSSIEPNEIGERLMEIMATGGWLCRHLHIPLQSGDNGILGRMNRHYTAQEFARLVASLHERIPLIALGVDVMAGFPGEDSRAYQNTFSLIEDLPVSYLHVFPYSARHGTPAAAFPGQVRKGVIKERAGQLRRLGQRKRISFHRSCLGKVFSVLTEGWESEAERRARGMTDNYLSVTFPAPRLPRDGMVPVRIVGQGGKSVLGEPLRSADPERASS